MRSALLLFAVVLLGVSSGSSAQTAPPGVSMEPVPEDSLAIYRSVLAQRKDEPYDRKRLSRYTKNFFQMSPSRDEACIHDLGLPDSAVAGPRDLTQSSLSGSGYEIVDPKQVEETDAMLGRAGILAFSALLTLSEVVYSKDGYLAAVRYSFSSGPSGNGGTLFFQRTTAGTWVLTDHGCLAWES